jgi:hypothetical protein
MFKKWIDTYKRGGGGKGGGSAGWRCWWGAGWGLVGCKGGKIFCDAEVLGCFESAEYYITHHSRA